MARITTRRAVPRAESQPVTSFSRRRKPAVSPAAAMAAIPGRNEAWTAAKRNSGIRVSTRTLMKMPARACSCGPASRLAATGAALMTNWLASAPAVSQPMAPPMSAPEGAGPGRGAGPRWGGGAEPARGEGDGDDWRQPEEDAVRARGGHADGREHRGAADAEHA